MSNLFKSFSQADSSTSRKFGGTGLGLAISKSLVELMKGSIKVKSVFNAGSVFTFDVLLEKADKPAIETAAGIHSVLKDKSVLIVDDNSTNRNILKGLLTHLGMEFEEANDGKAGYEKIIERAASNNPFDIILLDYHMPVMDGIEMAQMLQSKGQLARFPDIILLSSDDVNLQRNKLAEYGIKRYLIKPVFQDTLLKLLNEVLENIDISQPVVKVYKQKDINPAKKKYKVLLAEDNLINQKLAFGLLENLGCSVTIVNNGKEAVNAATTTQYDIIFMDIQMPEMDGMEATGLIREHEKQLGKHTPIVAMTAHAMKGDRELCLDAGMDEYTTKPISLKSITETIKRLNISPE